MASKVTDNEARRRFADSNPQRAKEAFAALEPEARTFLRSYLGRLLNPADAEDVVQETLVKAWDARERFRDRGRAAWLAFLKRIADHCRADLLRGRGVTVELPEEIPDEELSVVDTLMSHTADAARAADCLHAADVLWLELEPGLQREDLERRLLAAQLFYLEGGSASEVLTLLNASRPGAAVSRAQLDDWLQDPGLLRLLCCRELYVSGGALAERVLASGDWSEDEARVIGWRLRHGLSADRIAARTDCGLSEPELHQLGVRSAAAFPFVELMERLLTDIRERGRLNAAPHLARVGLWQRLAFQYRYWDDLALRDVLERVAPPAQVVEVAVTAAMLNVWLSGGRLLKRLARSLDQAAEGRSDV